MFTRACPLRLRVLPVLFGLAILSFALRSAAQDVGGPEQLAEAARLAQRIDELEKRIKELEEKFQKPMTVKAPFTVADSAGKPMFKVGDAGTRLTLGNPSSPIFRVADEGGDASLRVASGKAQLDFRATVDGAASALALASNRSYARIIAMPGQGAATEVVDGSSRAYLGTADGGARLKLLKREKQFFLVDSNSGASLKLGDDANPVFEARDAGDRAIMEVSKGPSSLHMHAFGSGHAVVDVSGSGGHSAQILSYPESSTVRVSSGSADGSFPADLIKLTYDSEGPHLLVTRGSKRTADLGTPQGRHTGLRIYDQEGELALHAGLGMNGSPGFSLLEGDDVVAGLIKNTSGEGLLSIGRPGAQVAAELGRMTEGKGTALRIYDTSGQLAVGAGIDDSGRAAVRVASKGKAVASMAVDKQGRGVLDVGEGERSFASMGMDDDAQPSLQLFAKGGGVATALSAEPDGSGSVTLFRGGGEVAAHLGPGSANNTALRIYGQGNKLIAGIGVDTSGTGAVRVADTSGAMMAGLAVDSDGGGSVVAYHKSGKPAASLAIGAGSTGTVQVYTTSGEVLGSLTQGVNGGMLQLNNLAGEPMVEAGTTGGVGMVRTGPIIRSPGATRLGMPGSFIMGKAQ